MKMRIHFTVPVALACILLAHAPPVQPHRIGPAEIYPDPVRTPGGRKPAGHAAEHPGHHLQPPMEHEADTAASGIHEQAEKEAAPGIRGHCPSGKGATHQSKNGEGRYHPVRYAFRQPGLLRGRPPYLARRRRASDRPEEPLSRTI
jgi:hypothetical protein